MILCLAGQHLVESSARIDECRSTEIYILEYTYNTGHVTLYRNGVEILFRKV